MAATHFSGPVYSSNGLVAGGGTPITYIKRGTIAVDPDSMLTLTASVVTLTITGAAVGDTVIVTPGTAGFTAGIMIGAAYVSAADTVKVDLFNATAGTVDNASLTCFYTLIRS